MLGEGKVGRLLDVGMGMLINGGMNGLLDGKKGGDGTMQETSNETRNIKNFPTIQLDAHTTEKRRFPMYSSSSHPFKFMEALTSPVSTSVTVHLESFLLSKP